MILLCKLNTFVVDVSGNVYIFPSITIYAVVFVKGGSVFTNH